MRHSYRPAIPPPPQASRTQVLEHLGLVAGLCEALGLTAVIDRATKQDPDMRMVTAGHAVTAMVLNGLGCINHQRYRIPHCFHTKPLARLMAPGIQARHLHDDTRGRALATRDNFGGTALYRRLAATAARRLRLRRTFRPRETTSLPVDGRSNSAPPPDAQGVPIPQGSRRDHRPERNHVRGEGGRGAPSRYPGVAAAPAWQES
jgi:hypothetical protein